MSRCRCRLPLERELRNLGYEPRRKAKHGVLWAHPCGATVQVAGTPGESRSLKNCLAQAKRNVRLITTNKEKQ